MTKRVLSLIVVACRKCIKKCTVMDVSYFCHMACSVLVAYGARQLAQRDTWLIQGETRRITHYDHSADIRFVAQTCFLVLSIMTNEVLRSLIGTWDCMQLYAMQPIIAIHTLSKDQGMKREQGDLS